MKERTLKFCIHDPNMEEVIREQVLRACIEAGKRKIDKQWTNSMVEENTYSDCIKE